MELDEEDYELLGWGVEKREDLVAALIVKHKCAVREWQKKNKAHLAAYKRVWRALRRGSKPFKKAKPPKKVKGPPKSGLERQKAYLQRKRERLGVESYRKWRAKKQREFYHKRKAREHDDSK